MPNIYIKLMMLHDNDNLDGDDNDNHLDDNDDDDDDLVGARQKQG